MSLYALKPAFQARLRPLVGRLAASGVTANQVTGAAAVGSMVVGALPFVIASAAVFLLIPIWLAIRMGLNAIDGMLAREHGQKSRLGGFLNEIGDVVSDAALYAPFALVPAFGAGLVALVVVLAILTEFAGVLGQATGGTRRYDGPLGKSDRALVFGALGAWVGISGAMPAWTAVILWAVVALMVLTTVNRVRASLREQVPA